MSTPIPEPAQYGADQIQVLEGLEHIRKRPAMYIGDTGARGLHHLVYEVVDNSVDEALVGECTEITVTIHGDGSVSVLDDGRGIPVDIQKDAGLPAVTVVLTTLHSGGKFERKAYKVSGGLHGVGLSCVNALSSRLVVEVFKDGHIHRQSFECGKPTGDLTRVGRTERRGTRVHFKPDSAIFPDTSFIYDTLAKRLRELAFLNKGISIRIRDERDPPKEEEFRYEGGLREFIVELNRGRDVIHEQVVELQGEQDGIQVDVAFQYTQSYDERIFTYCNNINTREGGTHLVGFKTALTRSLNSYAKRENLLKKVESLGGDDCREGLTAVVSVKVPEPQFEGQTKMKLGNSDVQSAVEQIVGAKVMTFLEETPKAARSLIDKALSAYAAREAARHARDIVRRKSALGGGGLPGKLADCSSHKRDETELYLVEGDSAGGSAKQGRERSFQAILPLRGKILNVEKARIDKMLAHEEIRTIITALGTGIGTDEFDISKLRYGKIIIMTDADVDGSHIRTLLLTFFFRHMQGLIQNGRIYVAQPPLFLLQKGKMREYVFDEASLARRLTSIGIEGSVLEARNGQAPRRFEGEALRVLLDVVGQFDAACRSLERHGHDVREFLARGDAETGALPVMRSRCDGDVRWWLEGQRRLFEDYEREMSNRLGREVVVAYEGDAPETVAKADLVVAEFPDGREASQQARRLVELGVAPRWYLEGTFAIVRGSSETKVGSLREALAAIRKLGQEGLTLQRYKGLGEMNAAQLWETTMAPGQRTLLRVCLEDAVAADEMFSILMGSSVENRRAFIEKNALEVRDLDI